MDATAGAAVETGATATGDAATTVVPAGATAGGAVVTMDTTTESPSDATEEGAMVVGVAVVDTRLATSASSSPLPLVEMS